MPRVSVIMGVHNSGAKVERAIASVLDQSFRDFEFIICDDGSTDETWLRLESSFEDDPRIKLLRHKYNRGLAPALNACLREASGEFVARMDDDDWSHPNRFEKQVAFLDEHPEYAIVGTSRNVFDKGGIWGARVSSGEPSKLQIFRGRTFLHPSVMMRRAALLEVGGYTTGKLTERTEDFDLWCKLYSKGYAGYNLSDILIDYYEARDSYKKRKYRYRLNEFRLKRQWAKALGIPLHRQLYALRPLIVGLFPAVWVRKYHERKYRKPSE
jgi:glycosyltransferase involved in cell wall biosynthesis